jgi:hypothetical protein
MIPLAALLLLTTLCAPARGAASAAATVDTSASPSPFPHYWKRCVGSGHMLLGTRAVSHGPACLIPCLIPSLSPEPEPAAEPEPVSVPFADRIGASTWPSPTVSWASPASAATACKLTAICS